MSLTPLLTNPAVSKLAQLIACAVWILKDEKDKSRQLLFLGLVGSVFYQGLLNAFMATANRALPWKYDYYLLCVDRAMGVSSGGLALALRGPWPSILNVVYGLMLPAIIFWLVLNRKANAGVVRAYFALLIGGPVLYSLLPAAGPVYTFGKEWTNPPVVQAKLIQLDTPINAFPSIHLAVALFFVLTAKSTLWRSLSLAFLAGTALATLTTGEHYVIDLVAGLAFGCFMVSVGKRKTWAALGYLGVALAWLFAIRWGVYGLMAHAGMVRLAAALTMALAARAVWTEWSADTCKALDQETALTQNEVSSRAMPSA